MATPITPVQYDVAGVDTIPAVTSDIAEGNEVPNAKSLALILANNTAADVTVTFITTGALSGYELEDLVVTLPAASSQVFGRFPAAVFGTSVEFHTSDVVDVTAYI